MKDRAVVLQLTARIVERDVDETWNSASSKVTIPGRPVTLKLVGANVVVAAQFTPYKKEDGKNILVAQGQVWVSTKEEGMLYYTSIQTIPIEYGERVYFFPLGQKKDDRGARIEVQLVLTPYVDSEAAKKPATPAAPPAASAAPSSGTAPSQTAPAATVNQPSVPAPAAKSESKTEQKVLQKVEQKVIPKTELKQEVPAGSEQKIGPKTATPKEEKAIPVPKPDGEKRAAE
ncbi:MAG: hypothetical protein WCT14_09720 [Treponemataceae bacterium]